MKTFYFPFLPLVWMVNYVEGLVNFFIFFKVYLQNVKQIVSTV